MKKKFKSSLVMLVALLFMSSLVPNSFAATTWKSISKTVYNNFTKDWRIGYDTKIDGYDAVLTYGFNTFAFNEDECSTIYYGSYHRPVIDNGNGVHYGSERQAHEWSDYEVRHSGSSVTYRLDYKVYN